MGLIPLSRPHFGAEERYAVDRILWSGMVAQGKETRQLEIVGAVREGIRDALGSGGYSPPPEDERGMYR